MTTFQKVKLGDVADVIDSRHETPSYSQDGYPMVRVTDIKPGYLNTNSCLKVDADLYNYFSSKHKSNKGDIVFSRVGSEGISSLVNFNKPFCLGQNTAFIIPKNKNNFLYYWLNSPEGKFQIKTKTTGATQRTISLESIKNLELIIPDLTKQEQISSILTHCDDLIESNEKRIKTLEEMAQLLYIEWFVKYEFPAPLRHHGELTSQSHPELVSGSNPYIGYKSSGGKMVDSGTEYGLIPEGWEVKRLSDVADILFGYSFKSNLFNEDENGMRVVRIRDVLSGDTETSTPEIADKKYLIKKGDLLIGMDGIFHMSMWFADGCFLNQRVVRIRSEKLSASFIFESIQKQLYFFQKTIVGATVGHLSNGNIRDLKILISNNNEMLLDAFQEITDLTINLKLKNQNLSKTRDLLIPQLVTGKIMLKK